MPNVINVRQLDVKSDQELLQVFLEQSRHCHDGDELIDRKEAISLLDRDNNHQITLEDWKLIATPVYLLSQNSFWCVADLLQPLLPQKYGVEEHPTTFEDVIDEFGSHAGVTQNLIQNTPKADLHLHFGGNTSLDFLYTQALDRVGPWALDPDRWGGRIDWASDKAYTNYHDFSKQTFDEVIRIAMVGKSMTAEEFIPPSQIVAEGQQLTLERRDVVNPEEQKRLDQELEENRAAFEKFAIYKAPEGASGSLPDFLNINRLTGSLVERTPSMIVQSAALEDAMRNFSAEGITYAEMKFASTKLKAAKKAFPELSDEDAIYESILMMVQNAVAVIIDGNEQLINEGQNPVDVRIVMAISRSASRDDHNLMQTRTIVRMLQEHPELAHWVVGFDGAAKEPGESPALYEEHLCLITDYNATVPEDKRLGITWHQGEAFEDTSIFGSLYRIEQLVDMGATRIGHGLVLGLDPEMLAGQEFKMPKEEYYQYLLKDKEQGFSHPIHVFVEGALIDIDAEIERVAGMLTDSDIKEVHGQYPVQDQSFIDAVRERQQRTADYLNAQGVSVEACVTSNLALTIIPDGDLTKHPLPYYMSQGLSVTINTDDAGVLGSRIANEYFLASSLLGLDAVGLNDLIDNGFDQAFAATVRHEPLEHLQ